MTDKRFQKAAIYILNCGDFYKVVTGNNKLVTCQTSHRTAQEAMKMALHHKSATFPNLPIVEVNL